jgi:hypothetical protein
MVYNTNLTTPPLPPPHRHKLSVYTVPYFGKGGGGEVREKIEGQQYTRIGPWSIGATVHKLGRKYQP